MTSSGRRLVVLVSISIGLASNIYAEDPQNPFLTDHETNNVSYKMVHIEDVPKSVKESSQKVVHMTILKSAVLMTKPAGELRSWYVLSGIEKVRRPVRKTWTNSDVKYTDAVFETVQVRLTTDGEILDIGRQINDQKVPAAVKRAFKREAGGAKATVMLEVRSSDRKELLGYRAIVEAGYTSFAYHISTDGSKVERE